MGRIAAHSAGDPRAIWLMLDGELVELTPMGDDHRAASEMARGLSQRFYLKRRWHPIDNTERWMAFDSNAVVGGEPRAFPSRDAAIMWALHRGGR